MQGGFDEEIVDKKGEKGHTRLFTFLAEAGGAPLGTIRILRWNYCEVASP